MLNKGRAEKKSAVIEIKDKKRGGKRYITVPPLCECRKNLVNPWRGWYQIFSFKADERPDFEELKWCLRVEESLVLVRLDIGGFAGRDLSEALPNMADILRFFADAGKGIILRVVYDTAGRGMKREPVRFAQVEEDLALVARLIEEFSEEIFVYQGLLIGSWGEMHDSAYLSAEHLRKLMGILLGIKKKNCYFAVRTPAQWRQIVSEEEFARVMIGEEGCIQEEKGKGGSTGSIRCGAGHYIGLFDDGMFGSENHLGTFGIKAEQEALWEESWRMKDELTFENRICCFIPCGGEAIGGSDAGKKAFGSNGLVPIQEIVKREGSLPEFKKVLERMGFMHTSYLNSVYDKRVLDTWRNEVFSGKDIWKGVNGYDYIGCRLGYRFVLRKIFVRPERKGQRRCGKDGMQDGKDSRRETGEKAFYGELEIEMENIGFGAFPGLKKSRFMLEIERDGEMVWREYFSGKEYPLPAGGKRGKLVFPFPVLYGRLYFKMEALVQDKAYTVYFGNEGYDERGILVGEIQSN